MKCQSMSSFVRRWRVLLISNHLLFSVVVVVVVEVSVVLYVSQVLVMKGSPNGNL